MTKSSLTTRQQAFVTAYVGPADRNPAMAAEIAGYRDAERHGAACMASSKVREAIRKLLRRDGGAHKFTVDRVERVLRAIRTGSTYRLAAMHAGISEDTLLNWRKGEFPNRDILTDAEAALAETFVDRIEQAEGDAALRHLGTVMAAAAQGDANVSLRFLEMRWPNEFGKKAVEVSGPDGGPIQFAGKSQALIEKFAAEEGISADDLEAAVQAFIAGGEEAE